VLSVDFTTICHQKKRIVDSKVQDDESHLLVSASRDSLI
jgi:WD40 repeat protein